MNVFLTGGTGFVGTAILPLLLESDKIKTVYMMYRSEATFNEEVKMYAKNPKIVLVKGDVLKPETMALITECQTVLYLVCNSKWGTLDSPHTMELALQGTKNVVTHLKPSQRLIYVSSAAAMMFDEDFDEKQNVEVQKDQFIYSKAKFSTEQYIKNNVSNYILFRPGEIYDKNDYQLITSQNIISYANEPNIIINGGISLVCRQQVARAIFNSIFSPISCKLYNLGGENVSIFEFSRLIQKITSKGHVNFKLNYFVALAIIKVFSKIKIQLFEYEAAKYGGLVWYMDSSEAAKDLDFKIESGEEALSGVVSWLTEKKMI